MQKFAMLKKLIVGVLLLPSYSFAEAYIIEANGINFGELIYSVGGCELAYDTRIVSDVPGSSICQSSHGQPGKYRIYAKANTLVRINVKSHNDDGSGIIFVPNGAVVSDAETKVYLADTAVTINSGISGIIEVKMGGRIQINTMLNSSTSYKEDFEIEFSEL